MLLKNKNSFGPDKISTNFLKSIIPIIMGPICHLFDLSFKTGFIPTTLKTAKTVPRLRKRIILQIIGP